MKTTFWRNCDRLVFIGTFLGCSANSPSQVASKQKSTPVNSDSLVRPNTELQSPEPPVLESIVINSEMLLEGSADMWNTFNDLSHGMQPDRVKVLQLHPDPNIALNMSWTRLVDCPLDGRAMEAMRFIGFLEHACRIRAPQWWVTRLSHYESRGNILSFNERDDDWGTVIDETITSTGDGHISVELTGEVSWIRDAQKVTINRYPQMRLNTKGTNCIAVSEGETHIFLAVFMAIAFPYKLYAINKSTGDIEWATVVRAGKIGASSGPPIDKDHRVQIVIDGARIFVFGVWFQSAYCECFNSVDGLPLVRCSSRFSQTAELFEQRR